MIVTLCWLLGALGYLIIGEAVAAYTAVLLPQTLVDRRGVFAWHLASLRVVLWWLVLLIGLLYALSIPVRYVHQRVRSAPAGAQRAA